MSWVVDPDASGAHALIPVPPDTYVRALEEGLRGRGWTDADFHVLKLALALDAAGRRPTPESGRNGR